MARFRKRPVSVEAVRLLWENWGEVCEFAGVGHLSDGKPQGCIVGEDGMRQSFRGNGYEIEGKLGLEIPTLEGLMLAEEGDWVIKGVAGELYPCKPEIFEKTYEAMIDEREDVTDGDQAAN